MGGIVASFEFLEQPQQSKQTVTSSAAFTTPMIPFQTRKNIPYHPELRKLRLLLTCDYGRPKFIKFLFRSAPVCSEILTEHQTNVINYISNFNIEDDFSNNIHNHPLIDLPIQILVNSCLTSILLLAGIAYFPSFITSSEGEDWIRYQHLLTESNHVSNNYNDSQHTLSESSRALSFARSHALVQGVKYDELIALMSKPHWIVTLARSFDAIPFPISIHGFGLADGIAQKFQATCPLLYANGAYLEMTGYSNQQICGTDYNHLDSPGSGSGSITGPHHGEQGHEYESKGAQTVQNAIKLGQKLRIGRVNYRANGELFQNFLTYQPVYDMENIYKFLIVVHCDTTTKGNDTHYLHKINLIAENFLPSQIHCTEDESNYLFAYFYNQDSGNESVHQI